MKGVIFSKAFAARIKKVVEAFEAQPVDKKGAQFTGTRRGSRGKSGVQVSLIGTHASSGWYTGFMIDAAPQPTSDLSFSGGGTACVVYNLAENGLAGHGLSVGTALSIHVGFQAGTTDDEVPIIAIRSYDLTCQQADDSEES